MLKAYFQLRDRTDRFVESVEARYSEQIACQAGCSNCCQGGLTLVMIEAVALGNALGINSQRVHLQAGQPPLSQTGQCSLLDKNKHCIAYSERPLICRTQGMPLLHPTNDSISICELNFVEFEPHRSAVLNTQNLQAALFAANLDYCQKAGLHPLSRIAIDRLAQMAKK